MCAAESWHVAFGNISWGQIVKSLRMKARTLLLVAWRHAGLGKSVEDSPVSGGVANGDDCSPLPLGVEVRRYALKLAG